MIEEAVVRYLNANTSVTTPLGGTKIYYGRSPSTVKMPYVTVRNSGGNRDRITQYYTDADDILTIYVEAISQFNGRAIAEAIMRALENYRGDMDPEKDLYVRCGSIRDLDGFQSTYRFIIPVYIRYKEITQFPS